jgi:hypothetical protein
MLQTDDKQAPVSLTVRELHAGGKKRGTTLLGPKQTDKAALKALYRDRWHVALDLRNIKTTLGRERLSGLTPERAVKEIGGLLADNLLRSMRAQAAFLARLLAQVAHSAIQSVQGEWKHPTAHQLVDHRNRLPVLPGVLRLRVQPDGVRPRDG